MIPEHYNKLKEGVDAWNAWRKDNPDVFPNLERANLWAANLERANLQGANLREADLRGANLQKAFLSGANLEKANLYGANLEEAILYRANLREANLWAADLQKANLEEANLQKANLQGANLQGARLMFIRYRRLGLCRGVLLEGCSGSPTFIRDAKDNEYIEECVSKHKFIYLAWSLSSDCGRSLFRWISWSLILALFFGCNFFMLGQKHFTINGNLPFDLVSMLYYSIITFTTLGFGDIIPQTHTGATWVVAEVITGYVMLGGLISIMASKLARRAS